MREAVFKTKWGWIGLAATPKGVAAVVLPKPSRRAAERDLQHAGTVDETSSNGAGRATAIHLKTARAAVEAYLDGKARSFDLPLDLEGRTPFQVKVWQALRAIPYGRVRSYGWVARKIGKPKAARAVGAACGANPVPLLVPCHRVVAGDGSLGGFSGGLPNKKRLLRLEGIRLR
jgi:methylated-DNA-[protein]-cysteine S-methyltransferase